MNDFKAQGLKIIGLTGGIACGKSTVSAELKKLGAKVIDADEIARQVVQPGEPAYQAIVDIFGAAVLYQDQTLNREALGQMVFSNSELRRKLEEITHPAIESQIDLAIHQAKNEGQEVVFLDVPLLFEVGWNKRCHEVWVVYVTPQIQLARLIERNGYSESEALARIKAQADLDDKVKQADVVINNSGGLAETRAQILRAWLGLKS